LRFLSSAVFLLFFSVALAQPPAKPAAASASQKTFDLLKTLAGNWQGPVTTDNPAFRVDKPLSLRMHVASRGNALVQELDTGTPEITVFYVDNDRLTLVHYCDFNNRPLLAANPSQDGKTVDFDFVSYSGGNEMGHVTHWGFTIVDTDHHSEDWTFLLPDGKPIHAHIDLKRVP